MPARARKRDDAEPDGSEHRPAEQAEASAAEGRFAEAIDLLTRANGRVRDPAVEERLVQLRLDAFTATEPRQASTTTADADDPFPGETTPPEVAARDLTPELLRSGIHHHGCLLVRGLVTGARIAELVHDIDRAFAGYDAHAGGASTAETTPWFLPLEAASGPILRRWAREGGAILAVDSPRTLFDVIQVFEEAGIRQLATAYLGEPPAMLARKCTLRRVAASRSDPGHAQGSGEVGWHQDGAFMGVDIRTLDVWLALSACGRDAAGLDIVARRLDGIVETGTNGARYDWTVAPDVAERTAAGRIVSPLFEPGDALLFDHLLLHRTGLHPGMVRDRYAIEAWFAASSSYPPDQLPVAY